MALDQQLLDRILASPQLPSLPAIALEIIGMVQEDEVDIDMIAQTISLDPALSSKMLKTVNSSFYGLPKTVASVNQAVIVLGLNSVKTLALGFTLVNNLTEAGGPGFNHLTFWRRSLYSATAAKQLCERMHMVQAEEVFIASLLQDVGQLALAQVLGEDYAQLVDAVQGDRAALYRHETDALGADHCDVGAALAESWSLPPLLVESIRLHERPNDAPENLAGLIRTVHAGALLADLIESPDDAARASAFQEVAEQWFGMGKSETEDLLKDVFKQAGETQRLFELPTGELAKSSEILAKARQALESVSLGFAKENSELREANETLKQQANMDALTGLWNRRQFDERLDEQFLAAGPEHPLSVVFIDLDQFKELNDTHGHPEGDAVLRLLTDAIREAVGEQGEVFRYGGDEFTLLCPGESRANASILAERVRVQVEQTAYRPDDAEQPFRLSVSIGVATYEGDLMKRPNQLVKAADQAVYAAKKAGRNAVRVFVPKPTEKSKDKAA